MNTDKNGFYFWCSIFLVILILLPLVHCSKVKQQSQGEFIIVAFGDSTTAERENIKKVYAQRLRDTLSQAHRKIKYRVINSGARSDTTDRARARFQRDVLAHEPDLVIIQFGLNDSCIDVFKGETKPRTPQHRYEENLIYFIDALKKIKARVILMTPNPMIWTPKTLQVWGKPPYNIDDPLGFNLLNKNYVQSVRSISKEKKVALIDVYQMFLDYSLEENQELKDLMVDGIHPNDKGHRMIVREIIAVIRAR